MGYMGAQEILLYHKQTHIMVLNVVLKVGTNPCPGNYRGCRPMCVLNIQKTSMCADVSFKRAAAR